MKNFRYPVLAAILGAALLWGAYERNPAIAQYSASNPPRFWEYRTVSGNPALEEKSKEYNRLGSNGWELSGVVSGGGLDQTVLIFKRQKQ